VVTLAGAVYVAAWVIGLLSAPPSPSQTATDADVQAFFVAHHAATFVQALLVHGIAGVALAVFVVSLARFLGGAPSDPIRRLFLLSGTGAAVVSPAQDQVFNSAGSCVLLSVAGGMLKFWLKMLSGS
jgi:hypothetical protein